MSNSNSPNRIARHPGQQGARSPAGNQAGLEKLATGIDKHWPRYFTITSKTGTLKNVSSIPFAMSLVKDIGEPEVFKRQKDGAFLIKCRSQNQSEKLRTMIKVGPTEINAIPHERLNSVRGVIVSEEALENSDEEIICLLYTSPSPRDS